MKLEILKEMGEIFEEQEIPAIIRSTEEEPELNTDILSVMLDGYGETGQPSLGEFFFLPTEGDDRQYFASVITLCEDIVYEQKPALETALAMLNFVMPVGAFVINPVGDVLAFKLVVPLISDLSRQQLFDQVNMCIAHAMDIAEPLAGALVDLAHGACELDDVLMLMKA